MPQSPDRSGSVVDFEAEQKHLTFRSADLLTSLCGKHAEENC
jgi:hypothetical protein